MTMDKKQDPRQPVPDGQMTPAATQPGEQLISPKGEEYLREAGSIEDLPNADELDEAQGLKGE